MCFERILPPTTTFPNGTSVYLVVSGWLRLQRSYDGSWVVEYITRVLHFACYGKLPQNDICKNEHKWCLANWIKFPYWAFSDQSTTSLKASYFTDGSSRAWGDAGGKTAFVSYLSSMLTFTKVSSATDWPWTGLTETNWESGPWLVRRSGRALVHSILLITSLLKLV